MRPEEIERTLDTLTSSAGAGHISATVADVVRTPDSRFDGLPGFAFIPHYREHAGLRLAHIDEGDGPPVVFLHGSPTWSYLWRKVIPVVRDAGYRCVAPDQVGYGRSDKPTDLQWYSYDRHVEYGAHLLSHLDLHDVTLVLHDWGVPVGLRIAAEHPDRVRRLAVMNGTLPLGHPPSEAWLLLRQFINETPDIPIGAMIRAGCSEYVPDSVVTAYEMPFPAVEFKSGARSGPLLRPTSTTHPDAIKGRMVMRALREDGRPKLVLWGDGDPIMPLTVGADLADAIGCDPPIPIHGASHFLQEDRGEEVGTRLVEWLSTLNIGERE